MIYVERGYGPQEGKNEEREAGKQGGKEGSRKLHIFRGMKAKN